MTVSSSSSTSASASASTPVSTSTLTPVSVQEKEQRQEHISTAVLFSAPSLPIVEDKHRLAPTYVGLRRVRPSNRTVHSVFVGRDQESKPSSLLLLQQKTHFVVKNDDGTERRMTKQEKKLLKLKIRQQKKDAKLKRKAEQIEQKKKGQDIHDAPNKEINPNTQKIKEASESRYHQLGINEAELEQELADLRGDRNGVPPVALFPSMARKAVELGLVQEQEQEQEQEQKCVKLQYSLHDGFAATWAKNLKDSMNGAEEVRKQEPIRPMAYQIVPEVWKRLRPGTEEEKKDGRHTQSMAPTAAVESDHKTVSLQMMMRRRVEPDDSNREIIFDALHSMKSLYISCGAKFGCDFLIYDGPRQERHAFAGLRIVQGGCLPKAYDLASYVRGLNTAGKLALLGIVDRSDTTTSVPKVAFVDLALEKILSAPTHARRGRKKARKEAGANLDKTCTSNKA